MDRIDNNYLFKNYSQHHYTSLFASNSTHITLTHCRTRALCASYYCCKLNHAEIEQLHSCRHRSCYVCAHKQRLDWIEKQKARLLDVPHFHVVFTLPHVYLSLWRYNEALFARILFKASQETLMQLLA